MPVTTLVTTAVSLVQDHACRTPRHSVPMLKPTLAGGLSPSEVSVALTAPVAPVKTFCVAAPLMLSVPVNVSVTDDRIGRGRKIVDVAVAADDASTPRAAAQQANAEHE